jgi:L-ascorbate metabolism protein UlaG (beta-lactamase superfamily)
MKTTALLFAPLVLLAACSKPSSPDPATPPPSSPATTGATAAAAPSGGADTFATKSGEVKVTPILHASTLLQVGGKAIYVDPFSKADFKGLPKADFVLISDIHGDHMDPKALDVLSTPSTVLIAPPSVAAELKGRANMTVLENGKKQSFGLFDVEAIPAYNLQRGPGPGKLFHDKGRGNGYVITFGDKRFYFSGDTECIPEMKALTSIDVAFVCMNLPYTMPPKEAAECVNAFKPKVLYPYHYAVPGGPSSNLDELKAALDPNAGVEVRLRKWY